MKKSNRKEISNTKQLQPISIMCLVLMAAIRGPQMNKSRFQHLLQLFLLQRWDSGDSKESSVKGRMALLSIKEFKAKQTP